MESFWVRGCFAREGAAFCWLGRAGSVTTISGESGENWGRRLGEPEPAVPFAAPAPLGSGVGACRWDGCCGGEGAGRNRGFLFVCPGTSRERPEKRCGFGGPTGAEGQRRGRLPSQATFLAGLVSPEGRGPGEGESTCLVARSHPPLGQLEVWAPRSARTVLRGDSAWLAGMGLFTFPFCAPAKETRELRSLEV